MKRSFTCSHCGKDAFAAASALNRSERAGAPTYCGKTCSGLARRKWKTDDQLRREKAAYDIEYNRIHRERRRQQKREYHKRTYDPTKAAIQRQKRMPYHVEYCRRPDYRKKKSEYDRSRRAVLTYGPFADCFLLLQDIDREVAFRATDYEVRLQNGTLNKALKRRRAYGKLERSEP